MPAAGRHRQGRPKGCKKRPRPGVPPGFARAGPLPKTKAFKRRRANGPVRRNSASAVPLRLPPFCRRPLCRARARHRARMRCPVTGAKRRCATKAARPVPAGCSQGIFLFRPASAFSAPGGSLCAGNWEKNVSCSKQLFVASLRCWLYFSPAAPICQLFFVRFVIFLAENLCKLQNIVQFEFFPAQETEAWGFGPRRDPLSHFRALPRLAAPGQNAADLLQFYVFSSFF